MVSLASISIALVIGAVAGYLIIQLSKKKHQLPLPPGPPRLPVIGNLHQAPKEWPWRTFQEWSQTYGPVMYLQFGGDQVIMLSSHAAATDLLEKRGSIYSNRPRLVMGGEVVSKGYRTLLLQYGPLYRRHQRIHGSLLLPRASQHYTSIQDLESTQLIHELVNLTNEDSTTEWMSRIHRYSSSLVFALAYGKRMPQGNEPEVQMVEHLMENFLYSARVGTWLVDAIPALNHLPTFLAPWKRTGDKWHAEEVGFYLDIAREALNSPNWNFTKEATGMKEAAGMTDKQIAYILGTVYEAGSDTTTQALQSFVLAAVLHPEAMREAQAELDNVCYRRLPSFRDRGRLPYVDAIVQEVLRWRPVSAGGIPHAVSQDDEYRGFRIPKGATVIGNHWAINHNPEIYSPDPTAFRPRRWLEQPDLPLPASFGWGRRACTGQGIAMNSLFINIARMLWAFDIVHAVDDAGARVEVDDLAYTQGFNSGPLPFRCRFEVRGVGRRDVVEKEWEAADKDIGVLLREVQEKTGKGMMVEE